MVRCKIRNCEKRRAANRWPVNGHQLIVYIAEIRIFVLLPSTHECGKILLQCDAPTQSGAHNGDQPRRHMPAACIKRGRSLKRTAQV